MNDQQFNPVQEMDKNESYGSKARLILEEEVGPEIFESSAV
jgi:hypothetical protein